MSKFTRLLEKNFKLLWKSKLLILTILIGPLLMVILLGMAFNNTKVYSIRIGVYSENYNELKNSIIDKLNENFEVMKFQNQEICLKSLKDYSAHVCMILPDSMIIEENEASEIVFFVDYSRINLVWMILDSLSSILDKSSAEISTELTNELLLKLNLAREKSLKLENLASSAENKEEEGLSKIQDAVSEMDLIDMDQTQKYAEDLVLQSNDIKEKWESIGSDIDKSESLVSDIGSNFSEFDEIEEELEELKETFSDYSPSVAGLGPLLEELDRSIFNIRLSLAYVLEKNEESAVFLSSSLADLENIQTTVQELKDELGSIKVTDVSKIVNPIITEIRPINEGTYFTFIYPVLIVLIIIFTSILLSSSVIIKEKKSISFFRNFISSTSELMFFSAYFITNLVLVLGSIFVFVIFAKVLFDAPLNMLFFLISIFLISFFILLGSLIGYISRSEQSSLLLGLTVSSILVFFSNTIIPIEGTSEVLKGVIEYNPLVISEIILRKILIYGLGLSSIGNDLLLLFIYILVLFAVLFLFLKFIYRNNFFRFKLKFKLKKRKKGVY
jgi:ABC-type multidrug transport system permease subunit